MIHWLEYDSISIMPDRGKKQLEEIRQYLRKYPDAKAEGYWKTTGDMFAKFVRLECNQSYDDLDLDCNSFFENSLRRHHRKPSNIEYSEKLTKTIYEGVTSIQEKQDIESLKDDCLSADDYYYELDDDSEDYEDMEL